MRPRGGAGFDGTATPNAPDTLARKRHAAGMPALAPPMLLLLGIAAAAAAAPTARFLDKTSALHTPGSVRRRPPPGASAL